MYKLLSFLDAENLRMASSSTPRRNFGLTTMTPKHEKRSRTKYGEWLRFDEVEYGLKPTS